MDIKAIRTPSTPVTAMDFMTAMETLPADEFLRQHFPS